jgi:hypothetical protein
LSRKTNSGEANRIFATLQSNYPDEIKQIHHMQATDMSIYGRLRPETEAFVERFMERVVNDNKRRRKEHLKSVSEDE